MNHENHVELLRGGVAADPTERAVWADLGAGEGAFTLALADLLPPGSHLYAVDRDAGALRRNQRAVTTRFPEVDITTMTGDFTQPLALPGLNGIVMANALHFVPRREQARVVEMVKTYLRPGGRLIVVEYNVDEGNMWVPYPLSFASWSALARGCGFRHTQLLGAVPSRFLREIYAAASQ